MDQADIAAIPAQICGLVTTISVAVHYRSESLWLRIPVGILLGIIVCAIIAIGIFYAIELVGRVLKLKNIEQRNPRTVGVIKFLFGSFIVLTVLTISCGTLYLSFLLLGQLGWNTTALK